MQQPADTHLAQLNVGYAADNLDSRRMASFVSALDRVNALAEASPGFVWRLQDESGNATGIKTDADPRFILNLSVWQTPEHLGNFVWRTLHKRFYEQRERWFVPLDRPHFVMWWVPMDHRPTTVEALARLEDLRTHGSTVRAFGWEALASASEWQQHRCSAAA